MTAWKTRAAVKEGNGGYWETTEWAREGEDEKSEKSESKDFLADDDGLLGRFGPGRGSVDTKEVRVGELVNVKLVLCKDQRGCWSVRRLARESQTRRERRRTVLNIVGLLVARRLG